MKNFVSVEHQRKHLTKQEKADRVKQEEKLKTDISKKDFKIPLYLRESMSKEDIKLWNTLVNLIIELNSNFLTKLDVFMIESLFNSIKNYRQATQDIAENGIIYRSVNTKGQEYTAINPATNVQKNADEMIKKTMNQLGLTIETRLKINQLRTEKLVDEVDEELGLDI